MKRWLWVYACVVMIVMVFVECLYIVFCMVTVVSLSIHGSLQSVRCPVFNVAHTCFTIGL